MTPDNGKSVSPFKRFFSSSSCSGLIRNLDNSAKKFEPYSDQPNANCETSAKANTCKKVEKPAKMTVSGTFVNVSF